MGAVWASEGAESASEAAGKASKTAGLVWEGKDDRKKSKHNLFPHMTFATNR